MPEAAANLLRVHLREYPRRQSPEVDEPTGILLIIDGIFAEGGQVLPVERMRGRSPYRRAGALEQFDPHGARHGVLSRIDERVERTPQRREPQAVIHQL